jgi:hypothetical protein
VLEKTSRGIAFSSYEEYKAKKVKSGYEESHWYSKYTPVFCSGCVAGFEALPTALQSLQLFAPRDYGVIH